MKKNVVGSLLLLCFLSIVDMACSNNNSNTNSMSTAKITTQSFGAVEYAKYGLKYNKDVYEFASSAKSNININYFHKPIFSLNDYWTINKKTKLTTSVYAPRYKTV